jgi:hypothetical protein
MLLKLPRGEWFLPELDCKKYEIIPIGIGRAYIVGIFTPQHPFAGSRLSESLIKENKTMAPKCPYCDFRSSNFDEQKRHLINKHHDKLQEFANKNDQTINWAAGEIAFTLFE